MSRTIAVQMDNVGLRLGSRAFHFDVSLEEGTITSVAGPSGSGKSTLLNLVAGFEQPDSGRVLIGGTDVTGRHPAERPVSIVFQDNNLFAHLDLFTNVGLGINPSLRLAAQDRAAVSSALARVGLPGYERRMPATLSGGERQRAAFARALVRRKPVLLLDEPFAALDPGLRASMADLLIEMHQETGITVLIVSHDPQEVFRLSQNVLFVVDGRIAVDASREDFFAISGNLEVDAFRGNGPP
ncbi:ATP-binding cassette domain-containing protein [Rhizobium sp. CG5]|uniref:thiamine ABC transporter ATP-binding protein n=1 Tax=Rhizobium sp. CG5 TaxID=2726076 RepID=UPI0020343E6C|nr:ATP-binding cassette domain-containing protein [Rhizobium sp. CG5]MCM2477131.1 ATP-binding cassette domain-containing protein [Rhizobium sp. CG5]